MELPQHFKGAHSAVLMGAILATGFSFARCPATHPLNSANGAFSTAEYTVYSVQDEPAPVPGTVTAISGCNLPSEYMCYVITAPTTVAGAAGVETGWQTACTESKGSVVNSCSTSSCVGTCTYTQLTGEVSSSVKYYYYSGLLVDASVLKLACTAYGPTGTAWSDSCN